MKLCEQTLIYRQKTTFQIITKKANSIYYISFISYWWNLLELQTVPFNLSNKNKSKSNLDGEQMEVTKRWETYSIVIDRNHTRFLLTATCNNNEQNIEKRKFVCQINCSIIFVAYFSTSQSEWVIAQVFMRMWTFFPYFIINHFWT